MQKLKRKKKRERRREKKVYTQKKKRNKKIEEFIEGLSLDLKVHNSKYERDYHQNLLQT